jgi:ParB-like chromosome segregation protein Spo0J
VTTLPFTPDQIESVAVSALSPYARNARTHSDTQVAQIAASIREFGFTNPVLIDAAGGIVAGHGRVLAAQRIGMGQVPCVRLSHLTEAQRRAYVIADNQLALNAGWDIDLLASELADLSALDFDLDLLGFGSDELAGLLGGDAPDGQTDPDEVPELQPGSPRNTSTLPSVAGNSTPASAPRSKLPARHFQTKP